MTSQFETATLFNLQIECSLLFAGSSIFSPFPVRTHLHKVTLLLSPFFNLPVSPPTENTRTKNKFSHFFCRTCLVTSRCWLTVQNNLKFPTGWKLVPMRSLQDDTLNFNLPVSHLEPPPPPLLPTTTSQRLLRCWHLLFCLVRWSEAAGFFAVMQ